MQHLTFSIAHVALKFRKQRDGSSSRHCFKHILLPVLAERLGTLRNFCCQRRNKQFLLSRRIHHLQHVDAIGINGIIQFLATTTSRSQHHLTGSLQIFLIPYISDITVLTVSLHNDGLLQLVYKIIEMTAHLLDLLRFVIPLLDLLRIFLHLNGKVIVYGHILQRRVRCRALQTLFNNRESVEHLCRDVQCQHCHQYHVHQVNHLLARRNGSFLYCHVFLLFRYHVITL